MDEPIAKVLEDFTQREFVSLNEWRLWLQRFSMSVLAETFFCGRGIITVRRGPNRFETLVYGGPKETQITPYTKHFDAVDGHKAIVEYVHRSMYTTV